MKKIEQLLEPGEQVVFRSRPAWGATAYNWISLGMVSTGLWLGGGILFAFGDEPSQLAQFIAIFVLILAVHFVLGLFLLVVTATTEVVVTDRRLLHKRCMGLRVDKYERSEIAGAQISKGEFLGPVLKIDQRCGAPIRIKDVVSLDKLGAALIGQAYRTAGPPLSRKARYWALLVCLAGVTTGGAAFLGLLIFLIPELQRGIIASSSLALSPLWEKEVNFVIGLVLLLILYGPILALLNTIGFLGFLPILLLGRVFLSSEDATRLLRAIWNDGLKIDYLATSGFLYFWLIWWLKAAWRIDSRICEVMLTAVYRRPIRCG